MGIPSLGLHTQSETAANEAFGAIGAIGAMGIASLGLHTQRGSEFGSQHSLRDDLSIYIPDEDTCIEGRFQVVRQIGRGKYGTVSEAKCLTTGRKYALKTMEREDNEVEVELTKLVSHPNVVRLHEVLRSESSWTLVLELCEGGSMGSWVDQRVDPNFLQFRVRVYLPPSSREVGILTKQLLKALAYLHHHKIAHRDVKVDNCLILEKSSSRPTLKLADFGLASTFQPGVPMTSSVGTLQYMAPEVLEGKYDERCDVWGAGAFAFRVATMMDVYPTTDKMPHDKGDERDKWEDAYVRMVLSKDVDFSIPGWESHTAELLQLTQLLLDKDLARRPRAKDISCNGDSLTVQCGELLGSAAINCWCTYNVCR
ncbi:unnamed protein product [Polarella glacialis]|uniref:Protein kinase domain-containing protein n=1 Tax=Polarella glacialis TaxID=89957 RepID=A0A813EFT1_POLGL|nr:unnamed protein product [Polarella glacialis]